MIVYWFYMGHTSLFTGIYMGDTSLFIGVYIKHHCLLEFTWEGYAMLYYLLDFCNRKIHILPIRFIHGRENEMSLLKR